MKLFLVLTLYISFFIIFQYAMHRLNVKGIRKIKKKLRKWNKAYKKASDELGLKLIPNKTLIGESQHITTHEMEGSLDGVQISVTQKRYSDSTASTPAFIYIRQSIDSAIMGFMKIYRESTFNQLQRKIGIDDFMIGDEAFDRAILLQTTRPYAMTALLSPVVRKSILNLSPLSNYFEISNSWFKVSMNDGDAFNSQDLIVAIRSVATISRELTTRKDVKKMLAGNIISEPLPAVCLKNIEMAVTRFPVDEELAQALETRLDDPDLVIQIESARHLKEPGMRHLSSLLETSTWMDSTVQALIISILGNNSHKASIPIFLDIYSQTDNRTVRIEILKAFRIFSDGALSPMLIDQLSSGDPDIVIHAIEALGTCGTVDAVEPLHAVFTKSSQPDYINAAQHAVASIQARLGNVERGWLSNAEYRDKEGALSTVNCAEEGSLSMEKIDGESQKSNHETKNGMR